MVDVSGYLHPQYANSFEEFGRPLQLPNSGGWIIKRQIPGFSFYDGMGCYPLFFCRDWSVLNQDLNDIAEDLICLSVVTDPFGDSDKDNLHKCFKDLVLPFKKHFIVDLRLSPRDFVSNHHRRNARKGLDELEVERCVEPTRFLADWNELYTTLIRRHDIKGMLTFSDLAFSKQLSVPGVVVFRAVFRGKTVGMVLWYIIDKIAYYHLGAYRDLGYKLRASFALFWTSIEYFASSGLQWLNLGGGAGIEKTDEDGLSRFKSGWASETRSVYFCGRIFDKVRYEEIVQAKGNTPHDYFPAYRKGEFF